MTRFFEKSFTFFILLLTLPLLFLPKINLVSFGGRETAGIRIDDFVLFLFLILFTWAHFQLGRRLREVEKWLFALVAFSLFSFALNQFFYQIGWIHVSGNLLYALRIVEYFCFFYIGLLAVEFVNPSTFILSFIVWNSSIMILQKCGLVGEFSLYGYNPSSTYRPPGICSFPSEAGAMLNMLFCYLIFRSQESVKRVPFWPPVVRQMARASSLYLIFLFFAFLTVISGSRIAIFAVAVIFLYCVGKKMSWRTPWTIAISTAVVVLGGGLFASFIVENEEMIDRSKGLLSMKNLELVTTMWNNVDISREPNTHTIFGNGQTDMSWWIRIQKWCYALKIYVSHPITYLQGVGPGFAFAGLDGGYLRIVVENGIIGAFLYWKFFASIAKKSPQLKWMVIALGINMIFFDAYIAYKPMSLLFLVAGLTWGQNEFESKRLEEQGAVRV